MTHERTTVAAFDFDGTISYRDTLSSFLLFSVGFRRYTLNMLILLPIFMAYITGFRSRQQTKEKVLRRFFHRTPVATLRELGRAFALSKLDQHIRPEALERIAWHRQHGDRCVLVSASLEAYLAPWAEAKGFEATIASVLEADEKGLFTGRLQGLNCRSQEKVRRLEERMGPRSTYILYAYGDSDGDRELLASADHPFFRRLSEKS